MSDVKLLAVWDGWCDPCGVERPLALTEHGPRGVHAWLTGVGSDDRTLVLGCQVCGEWQSVPHLEEEDPAVADAVVPAILATAIRPSQYSIIVAIGEHPTAQMQLPAPRRGTFPALTNSTTEAALLSLLADGLDVVSAR